MGCVHGHLQEVAEYIDPNMALTPFDCLASVDAAFFTRVLGFDALRVDDSVTGRYRTRVGLAMERVELIQCRFPDTAFAPSAEMIVNRLPQRKIVGQHAPLAARFHDVQDGVNNPFTRMQTPTTTPVAGLKMVMNQIPFGVC